MATDMLLTFFSDFREVADCIAAKTGRAKHTTRNPRIRDLGLQPKQSHNAHRWHPPPTGLGIHVA
jgi:hypothetical protein